VRAVNTRTAEQAAIRTQLGAIFVSLELSRSTWLVTSMSPGGGEKMSKHPVRAGDVAGLLGRFSLLVEKARARTGEIFPLIVIQEAGLDGFWLHRALVNEGIESWIVDAASIATSRRRRRAKTDKIDGETLDRVLLAYKRGEPRVCAMVRVPRRRRKIGAGSVGSARRWSPSGPTTSTASRVCYSRRECSAMSRCDRTAGQGSMDCGPATADRCRHTSRRRSAVNSIGSSSFCDRSKPSRWTVMPWLRRDGTANSFPRQWRCSRSF
jgi:hypothetical protein